MDGARDVLLAVHVVAGTLGLVLGPLALIARGRRRSPLAGGYHAAVLVVAVTAIALVAFAPAVPWWLIPLAIFAYACLWAGLHARPGWLSLRLHGFGGSYIALVTALLVVSIDGPAAVVAWTLPTGVCLVLIEREVVRARRAPPPERRLRGVTAG